MNSSEKASHQLVLTPTQSDGQATARHYRDGSPLLVTWTSGVLSSMEPGDEKEAGDLWIAPGLIDLQVNGYAGVDFQRDDHVSEESLLKMVRAMKRDGCHRTLLTLITAPWEDLTRRMRNYRKIIQANPELKAALPGWHIEGPFLSHEPGFSGAHNPSYMHDPTPGQIREFKEIVGDDPMLLTLAPEREGSEAAIREAVNCGFVISFGHTNASASQLHAGVKAGGRAFTHFGNGVTQQLDRHDNILWRVLNEPSLVVGLIPDSIHVSPALFRIFHRTIDPALIYWTTDAMAAGGAPPGLYSIAGIEVMVGEDRVVRNPVTKTFAGSALEPIEGIRRGSKMLDRRWQDVWDFFSANPARLMGLPSDLSVGSPAGFCLLRES